MSTLASEAELEPGNPWLERCRDHDALAWSEFFNRYHGFVRKTARRLGTPDADLDDVAQEVFTVAFRHIRTFQRGRMTTWLFRLVSNVVTNRHRSRRVRERFLSLLGRQPEAVAPRPDQHHDASEARVLVHSLLARMAPKKRDVFALFELEGLQGAEIAELLDINLSTVWTRLHHARKDFETLARKAGIAVDLVAEEAT